MHGKFFIYIWSVIEKKRELHCLMKALSTWQRGSCGLRLRHLNTGVWDSVTINGDVMGAECTMDQIVFWSKSPESVNLILPGLNCVGRCVIRSRVVWSVDPGGFWSEVRATKCGLCSVGFSAAAPLLWGLQTRRSHSHWSPEGSSRYGLALGQAGLPPDAFVSAVFCGVWQKFRHSAFLQTCGFVCLDLKLNLVPSSMIHLQRAKT